MFLFYGMHVVCKFLRKIFSPTVKLLSIMKPNNATFADFIITEFIFKTTLS